MLKSRSECEEVIGGGQARVECITQDTGSSKLSVQTDTSGHRYFMAGKSDTSRVAGPVKIQTRLLSQLNHKVGSPSLPLSS